MFATQPALFDNERIDFHATPRTGRTNLGRQAWVEYQPGWLTGAGLLFDHLVNVVPWNQREVVMWERKLPEPRLTWWWQASDGTDEPHAILADIRRALSDRYGVAFDSIGLNLYRDGRDSVAWHGDRIRHVMDTAVVAILSLGEARVFRMRPAEGGPSRVWGLGHGDLFVMGGSCQSTWQHTVPKVTGPVGPRLSVTFRHGVDWRESQPGRRVGAAREAALALQGPAPGWSGARKA